MSHSILHSSLHRHPLAVDTRGIASQPATPSHSRHPSVDRSAIQSPKSPYSPPLYPPPISPLPPIPNQVSSIDPPPLASRPYSSTTKALRRQGSVQAKFPHVVPPPPPTPPSYMEPARQRTIHKTISLPDKLNKTHKVPSAPKYHRKASHDVGTDRAFYSDVAPLYLILDSYTTDDDTPTPLHEMETHPQADGGFAAKLERSLMKLKHGMTKRHKTSSKEQLKQTDEDRLWW